METSAVDPVAAATAAAAARPATPLGAGLGRDEFLRLLVAKLANQDPLQPSKDEEFVAQLATFSSLEQLISANKQLEAIALGQDRLLAASGTAAQSGLIPYQAIGLIGKQALVAVGDQLTVRDGQPEPLVYALPGPAQHAVLEVYDGEGQLVRTVELDTSAGVHSVDWSGSGAGSAADSAPSISVGGPASVAELHGPGAESGALAGLPDGEYRVVVNAVGPDGSPLSAGLYQWMPIEGVSFLDGWIALVSGEQTIPFDSILEIRNGGS